MSIPYSDLPFLCACDLDGGHSTNRYADVFLDVFFFSLNPFASEAQLKTVAPLTPSSVLPPRQFMGQRDADNSRFHLTSRVPFRVKLFSLVALQVARIRNYGAGCLYLFMILPGCAYPTPRLCQLVQHTSP